MQCDILEMIGVMRGKEIHRGRKKNNAEMHEVSGLSGSKNCLVG